MPGGTSLFPRQWHWGHQWRGKCYEEKGLHERIRRRDIFSAFPVYYFQLDGGGASGWFFFFFLRYFGCPPSFVNIHGNWTAEMEFISYHSFFVYVKLDFVKTLFFVRIRKLRAIIIYMVFLRIFSCIFFFPRIDNIYLPSF